MRPRSLLALALTGLVLGKAAFAEIPDGAAAHGSFTRFVEDAIGSRLQTGIGSYRNRDGVTVDLIGAIHIGDRAYYEKLNRRFTRYDAMLYEMVGAQAEQRRHWQEAKRRVEAAEQLAPGSTPVPEPTEADRRAVTDSRREESARDNFSWLHPMYDTLERALGLSGQMEVIDYRRPNFVHADMTAQEFAAMQREKNETFLTLWWKSVIVQMKNPEAAPQQPGLLEIMEGLCRQEGSLGLRRAVARTFGSIEGMLSGIEGEDGSVILAERNKVALRVLEEQIRQGRKRIAIFYGAAHLSDMERRLEEMGFERTGGEWFTAWDMPPPKVRTAPAR